MVHTFIYLIKLYLYYFLLRCLYIFQLKSVFWFSITSLLLAYNVFLKGRNSISRKFLTLRYILKLEGWSEGELRKVYNLSPRIWWRLYINVIVSTNLPWNAFLLHLFWWRIYIPTVSTHCLWLRAVQLCLQRHWFELSRQTKNQSKLKKMVKRIVKTFCLYKIK